MKQSLDIVMALINAGLLPKKIPTSKVHKILDNKAFHKKRLYNDDDLIDVLGRERKPKSYRRDFVFDTIKVIQLKIKQE